jgi:hypothetical protein
MPAAEAQRDSQATIGVNFYCGFGTQGASDNLIQLPFQLQFPPRICSKQNYAIVARGMRASLQSTQHFPHCHCARIAANIAKLPE